MRGRYILGGFTATSLVIMLGTVFLFGAIYGAHAAHVGESPQQYKEALGEVDENVVEDVRANSTGAMADIKAGIARNLAQSTVAVGRAGVDFGYTAPWAAVPLSKIWPFVVIGTLFAQVVVLLRRLQVRGLGI